MWNSSNGAVNGMEIEMPNCFQLFYLNGDKEPVAFQQVDNAICHNLELPWDEKRYVNGWFDFIGFKLAMGQTFQQIADDLQKTIAEDAEGGIVCEWTVTMLRINHYLMEHYTCNAWVEIGRR